MSSQDDKDHTAELQRLRDLDKPRLSNRGACKQWMLCFGAWRE